MPIFMMQILHYFIAKHGPRVVGAHSLYPFVPFSLSSLLVLYMLGNKKYIEDNIMDFPPNVVKSQYFEKCVSFFKIISSPK